MKIFVTGASGFLGREFMSAAAAAAHEVVGLVRRRSDETDAIAASIVEGDVLRLGAEDWPADIDAVVHFATGNEGDAETVVRVAVEGTRRMLQLARDAGVARFVHVSSLSVHSGPVMVDDRAAGGYRVEPSPELRGAYARSKVHAELVVTSEADDAMEIVVCRPGLVFGRDMVSVLAGTAVQLPLGLAVGIGRAEQSVPWIDVQDLNAALLGILESRPAKGLDVYELLPDRIPTKSELVGIVREFTGLPRRTVWLPEIVASLGAAAHDTLRRDWSRRSVYAAARAWRFDPAAIDTSRTWARAGRPPRVSVRESIRSALTIEARLDAPLSWEVRERAAALLRVARGPSVVPAGQRVVLVGAGRIVEEMHVPAIASLEGVAATAVVDPRTGAAGTVAAALAARPFARLENVPDELLAGATVVVATPGSTHAAIAEEAVARGASVLLEKPAALRLADFERLCELESPASPITVLHNYRLRPAVLRLWEFLLEHDVGPLVRARLRVASPPLKLERARWMRDERRNRALLHEIAVHFVDVLTHVAGPISLLDGEGSRVRVSDDGLRTISFSATGSATACDDVFVDFDLAGTAPGVRLFLEFARSACVLDFFPDGFRIHPRRPNPLDDVGAGVARIGAALRQRTRRDRATLRAIPHRLIYEEHFRRCADGTVSAFGLGGVADTMRTLELLATRLYGDDPVKSR